MEKPNLTPEEKEKNQKYILDNLDNYWPDPKGNFVNNDFDTYGKDYFCIDKNAVTDYKEILWEMTQKIVKKEREDWELIISERIGEPIPISFKNKKTGLELQTHWFGTLSKYMIGEFGYRGWRNGKKSSTGVLIWGDYDRERNIIKYVWENRKKANKGNTSTPPQNPTSTNPEPETKKSQEEANKAYEKAKKQAEQETQNQEKQNPNPNQPNPSPNQVPNPQEQQDQPTNNPLPTPETIQENYNNDKDKSVIENNSNLTNEEQKEQANELLKLIITAELLIKEQKFNSEILIQLIKAQEQNDEGYQLLNQEGRIEQVISQLQSIEKAQRSSNSGGHNNQKPIPFGNYVAGIILAIVGLGTIILLRKKRNKN